MSNEKQSTILDFMNAPEMGRPDDPPFKKGKSAAHPLGVLYQGPWEVEGDGFSEHVQRCARALAMTGCPVHLRSLRMNIKSGTPKALPNLMAPLITETVHRYSTSIHQLLPTLDALRALLTHRQMSLETLAIINRFRVISTVFERDRLSKDVIDTLKSAGQVWVACHQNADILTEYGIPEDKVRVIPIPYFDNDPLLKLRSRIRKPGPPRFYHIGKWEPRKAQDQILRGFMSTFSPKEAHLIMKCSAFSGASGDGYQAGPREAIVELLKDKTIASHGWNASNVESSIEIISGRLTQEQIVALHSFGDVYVTLSRGEGFDMPAFDAKIAGNIMVYTPSGGPQDFADRHDQRVAAHRISKPCDSFYGWEPDACYLDYDIENVVKAMKRAFDIVASGKLDLVTLADRFRAESVGERMLFNLQDLVSSVNGKVF